MKIGGSIPRRSIRGQSTVEYLIMVAFGAIFAIQIAKFFNGVFQDGVKILEQSIACETASGAGFTKGVNGQTVSQLCTAGAGGVGAVGP